MKKPVDQDDKPMMKGSNMPVVDPSDKRAVTKGKKGVNPFAKVKK